MDSDAVTSPVSDGDGSVRHAVHIGSDGEAAGDAPTKAAAQPAEHSLAPAVTRAAAVLDALAAGAGAAVGMSELARTLGLPKSSISNICQALLDTQLIERSGGGFVLGRKLAELGGAYLAGLDVVRDFQHAAEGLPAASQETMQLAVLDGLDVIYVGRHDGRQPIRLASELGRRLPASCTAVGKAALASLPSAEVLTRLAGVERLEAPTDRAHRTPNELLVDLDRVRKRGYAIDDEEMSPGIVCIGVAIPRRRVADPPYAASVTLLKARADDERLAALARDLLTLRGELASPLTPPSVR